MRIARAIVFAALLASTSQASELVDNYDIIDAESGVSEFTRDIASALNRLQSTRLLLNVERDVLGKSAVKRHAELGLQCVTTVAVFLS